MRVHENKISITTKVCIRRSEVIDAIERMVEVYTGPEYWCRQDAVRLRRIADVINTYLDTTDRTESHLLDLLAVLHRDGGHYTAEHGIKKSVEAALKIASDKVVK